MYKYQIVYAFLDETGAVIRDEEGIEIFYIETIITENKQNAINIFNDNFKYFKNKPEIYEIKEVI